MPRLHDVIRSSRKQKQGNTGISIQILNSLLEIYDNDSQVCFGALLGE